MNLLCRKDYRMSFALCTYDLWIIITAYMDETYETRKYSADKIALLGLLILALLVARFIVASKSAIILSEPIELSYTGLSVSIPAGNGWRSEKRWKYRKNAFTLSSFFASRSSPTALVHCRYLLAATETDLQIRFEQRASTIGGEIAETGQTLTDTLTIDWARITRNSKPGMFFGTAQLPNNRQFDIEVQQLAEDPDLAERVFKVITENLKFEDNQLLAAGSEVVTKIKDKGLHYLLNNQPQQSYFLVKDAANRTIGFTMDVLTTERRNGKRTEAQTVSPLNVRAAGFLYLRGRYTREQTTIFQSDSSFDEFAWKSETIGLSGRSGTELTLDENAVMTVIKFSPHAEEEKYRLSAAAIPDVFLEQLLSQTLDSDNEKIIVDIIDADGVITPTLISRIETEDAADIGEKANYALKLEFLDGRGFYEQLYLDNRKQILKGLLWQESVYTLERTSIENILREFPERADYISQKNKMLKQDY